MQVLGGCRHENLLPLIGFSADEGVQHEHAGVCLVMPLMKGGSLEDRLFLDPSARRRLGRLSDVAGVGGAPVDVHEGLTGSSGYLCSSAQSKASSSFTLPILSLSSP